MADYGGDQGERPHYGGPFDQRPKRAPQTFCTGLRHYAWDSWLMASSFPLNRVTISYEGIRVRGFLGPRIAVPWRDIELIERTSRGVRFHFVTERMPIEVSTPHYKALIEAIVNTRPDKYDPTITNVRWWRIEERW